MVCSLGKDLEYKEYFSVTVSFLLSVYLLLKSSKAVDTDSNLGLPSQVSTKVGQSTSAIFYREVYFYLVVVKIIITNAMLVNSTFTKHYCIIIDIISNNYSNYYSYMQRN